MCLNCKICPKNPKQCSLSWISELKVMEHCDLCGTRLLSNSIRWFWMSNVKGKLQVGLSKWVWLTCSFIVCALLPLQHFYICFWLTSWCLLTASEWDWLPLLSHRSAPCRSGVFVIFDLHVAHTALVVTNFTPQLDFLSTLSEPSLSCVWH